MSWKEAKDQAAVWLQTLGLPEDLHGQEIDLTAFANQLTHKGRFREMVLRACARQLKARGAKIKQ